MWKTKERMNEQWMSSGWKWVLEETKRMKKYMNDFWINSERITKY